MTGRNPIQMPLLRRAAANCRRIAWSAAMALAWICSIRSTAAGLGGDGTAFWTTAAAALAAFVAGSAASSALAPRCLRHRYVLALGSAAALLLPSILLGPLRHLCLPPATGSPFVLFFLALIYVILPFGASGALLRGAPLRRFATAATGAAIALAAADGPWIPDLWVRCASLALPFAMAALGRGGVGTAAPATHIKTGPAPIPACAAAFLVGAGAALSLGCLHLEMVSFVYGSAADLSTIAGCALLAAAAGAAVSGVLWVRAQRASLPLAGACLCVSLLFAAHRISLLAGAEAFRNYQLALARWIGSAAGAEWPWFPAWFVWLALPFPFVAAGAVAGAAGLSQATARFAALGAAAGFITIPIAVDSLWRQGTVEAQGFDLSDGFWLGQRAIACGVTLGLFAARRRRIVASIAAALAVAVAFGAPRSRFELINTFNATRRLVPEVQDPLLRRESADGIATLITIPQWKDDARTVRVPRVRLGRTYVTPAPDEVESWRAALVKTALLHGKPASALVLGAPRADTARDTESNDSTMLLRAFGTNIQFAPVIPATRVESPERDSVHREGSVDLVLFPPQPAHLATLSRALRASWLSSWESLLNPGGVMAVFLDASTVPASVVDRLRREWLEAHEYRRILYVSDGLRAPSIGFVVRRGIPFASPSATPIPDSLLKSAASIGSDAAIATAGLETAASRSALDALAAWLPPVAVDRGYAVNTGRDPFDRGPRTNRMAVCGLAATWGAALDGQGTQAALGALARAAAAFDSKDWNLSAFRRPADERPLPTETGDAIVASLRAQPGHPGAVRAFQQFAELLKTQGQFEALWRLAEGARATDAREWRFVFYYCIAVRSLKDPESALAAIRALGPVVADGAAAILCEEAAATFDSGHEAEAIALLQRGIGSHSTSPAVARALAELLVRSGKPREALAAATHYKTLTPDDPDASAFVDSIRARLAAGTQPSSRATDEKKPK